MQILLAVDGIARLLLGSVARSVLTHARCSVLIVRNGAPRPSTRSAYHDSHHR